MTFPSFTLLAQSALSGLFIGSLYGLLGLGVGLSWGLLHIINLAHFGFAFLAAFHAINAAISRHQATGAEYVADVPTRRLL